MTIFLLFYLNSFSNFHEMNLEVCYNKLFKKLTKETKTKKNTYLAQPVAYKEKAVSIKY